MVIIGNVESFSSIGRVVKGLLCVYRYLLWEGLYFEGSGYYKVLIRFVVLE